MFLVRGADERTVIEYADSERLECEHPERQLRRCRFITGRRWASTCCQRPKHGGCGGEPSGLGDLAMAPLMAFDRASWYAQRAAWMIYIPA
jgi:hypothetical protein